MNTPSTRVARGAALLGLALALAYLESFVVLMPSLPGVKLGLANIAVLLALYADGWPMATAVSLLRVVIAGLLFGGLTGALFGLAGAVLSLLCMALLYHWKLFGLVGISMAGGACHNIGQLLMARWLLGSEAVFYYLPPLIIVGLAAGLLTGAVAWLAFRHIRQLNGGAL